VSRINNTTTSDGDDVDKPLSVLQLPQGGHNSRALAFRLLCAVVTVDVGVANAGAVDKPVRDNGGGAFPWRFGASDYWFAELAKMWCHDPEAERERSRQWGEMKRTLCVET